MEQDFTGIYTRRIQAGQNKVTQYVWVHNVNSSEERVTIETDINKIYKEAGPADRIYILGSEVRIKLTVDPIGSQFRDIQSYNGDRG